MGAACYAAMSLVTAHLLKEDGLQVSLLRELSHHLKRA